MRTQTLVLISFEEEEVFGVSAELAVGSSGEASDRITMLGLGWEGSFSSSKISGGMESQARIFP